MTPSPFHAPRMERFHNGQLLHTPHQTVPTEEVDHSAQEPHSHAAHLLSAICWVVTQQTGWSVAWWRRPGDPLELVARLTKGSFVFEIWLEDGVLQSVPAVHGVWWPHAAVSAPAHHLMEAQHARLSSCVHELASELAIPLQRGRSMLVGSHVDATAPTLDPINPQDALALQQLRQHKSQKG
jgi:hypothetical protein